MGQFFTQINKVKVQNRFYSLLTIATICIFLSSCSSLQDMETASSTDTSSEASHIITIIPQAGDTPESLAEEYGGEVIAFEEGELALIGLSVTEDNSEKLSQLASGSVDANSNAFNVDASIGLDASSSKLWAGGSSKLWAGGSSKLWAGGSSKLWAGGSSKLWAGGQYSWMPENTVIWNQIRLSAGHNKSQNLGLNTIVAVIDTGVDYNHPALSEAMLPGKDFYDNDNNPFDEGRLFTDKGTGHGTHVAGIIRQVAPRAKILPIRVLGPDGKGNVADLAAAILWAEKQGADVINLSLGSEAYFHSIVKVIESVKKKGVVVVASAGNQGYKGVNFPARKLDTENSQISVTSVNKWDNKSSFANYNNSVEISAPGEHVYSPAPGNRKVAWSGTSMAAPMVAGAMALGIGETSKKVPNHALATQLKQSAFTVYNNNKNKNFKDQLGKGRLDIGKFFDYIR